MKKQYIGEAKRMLRERFKEHRQATNNPNHSNATVAVPTHFNFPGHSSKDMRLIPLELQRPSNNGSRRKAREACLIERGRTLTPDGPPSPEKSNQFGRCLFRCTRAYQISCPSYFCFFGYLIG